MHLLRSLTIPFAALTGCFLWISSLFAGWTANWMVLNRLPEAIAQSRRIRRWLGEGGAVKMAGLVQHHFSGVAGYVCLGLLLGLLPFVSVFAGMPRGGSSYHVGERIVGLRREIVNLERRLVLGRGSLGGAGLLATGLLNFESLFRSAYGWLARALRGRCRAARKLVELLWKEIRQNPARFLWRHESETRAVTSSARGASA